MNLILQNIVPAIRMIVSEDTLKSIAFYPKDELKETPSGNVLQVDISAINLLDDEVRKEIKKADYIVLEGEGTIVVSKGIPKGRVAGRVFIITGGAQGFGAGVAEEIFNEGGNVVIADLNEEKGNEMAKNLNAKGLANKALFVKANVAEFSSVENLVFETTMAFGGLDVMISNAGILRAGGLDEMTPETFRLMTEVNYSGYFNCAKAAAKIMKQQTLFKKDHFCDILQINSKSGLKGSKKNFAYAGGKFGGIGLTQSFALELMPDNIKVNSICPGNFFDGPLWSDPENGLFVQYLNAGKVPGAKTVEDVKAFYEGQVPAGRGCRVIDVARAIFYAVEQEYETGQAIPVTGGQEMLK